jgi:polysaccharide biosynthesis/export protein
VDVRTLIVSVVLASMTACAAGKFRYDRYSDGDEVDVRDLEELIADGSASSPIADALAVEQVDYDFTAEQDEYRLGKNDVLNIFVLDHPELSSQRVELGEISGTTIRKDGTIHLPVVGSLPAEGLTLSELETALQTEVARYVVSPHVHVEILRHESQKFYVLGEVAHPGAFPVDGDTTLIEAVSLAGGVPPTADLESATVIRGGKLLPINLADVLRRGDVSRNVYMKGGDLVYVPDNVAKQVFVLGEVVQPTAVQIERDALTLAEALAKARGPTPASARRELAVIRGGFAKPIVYRIDLDEALLYDDRIKLRAGDRVVVAPTGLATASRYMQQILPFLVGAQALGLAASGGTNVAARATAAGGN